MKVDLTRSEIEILINVIKPLWQESIENPELADALEKLQSIYNQYGIIDEKWVLCECASCFNVELDQSMQKVIRIFQVFNNKDDAENALDMYNDFYDYDPLLAVVSSNDLKKHFR